MELEQELTQEQPHEACDLIDVCLLAGKIMLKNGAETNRVEDTMSRIAASYGISGSHSYVTPTVIMFSIQETDPAKLVRILDRSTNLRKVTAVNSISRHISSGKLTLAEAYESLKQIDETNADYHILIQIVCAAIASGCFVIMFAGGWRDFLPATLAGGVGYAFAMYFHRLAKVKFFAELIASFVIGLIAIFSIRIGWGYEVDKIIIGSVMPLVPGILITNAVRDLMAGHLVSGLSKGAEAFLTAFAIGTGIAMVITLF